MTTACAAAVAALSEIGGCQDELSCLGVNVARPTASFRGVMSTLHLAVDEHRELLKEKSDRVQKTEPLSLRRGRARLRGVDFLAEVLGDQVQQGGAQLDDLLVGEALALQLAVEALGDGLVPVQVQFFRVFVGHGRLHRGGADCQRREAITVPNAGFVVRLSIDRAKRASVGTEISRHTAEGCEIYFASNGWA